MSVELYLHGFYFVLEANGIVACLGNPLELHLEEGHVGGAILRQLDMRWYFVVRPVQALPVDAGPDRFRRRHRLDGGGREDEGLLLRRRHRCLVYGASSLVRGVTSDGGDIAMRDLQLFSKT